MGHTATASMYHTITQATVPTCYSIPLVTIFTIGEEVGGDQTTAIPTIQATVPQYYIHLYNKNNYRTHHRGSRRRPHCIHGGFGGSPELLGTPFDGVLRGEHGGCWDGDHIL